MGTSSRFNLFQTLDTRPVVVGQQICSKKVGHHSPLLRAVCTITRTLPPPPLMTFTWNCSMCPKSSFNTSPTLMLYKLVRSGMKEELWMFLLRDSPFKGAQIKVESSWGGIWDSRHSHTPQCDLRRIVFMLGSGRSRNYTLSGLRVVIVRRSTERAKCLSLPCKTRAYPSVDEPPSEFPADSLERDL